MEDLEMTYFWNARGLFLLPESFVYIVRFRRNRRFNMERTRTRKRKQTRSWTPGRDTITGHGLGHWGGTWTRA